MKVNIKYFSVLSLTLIIVIMLIGCTESKTKKIEALKEEATTLISNNKYDDAISKYDEILTIENSPAYLKEKNDILSKKYLNEADSAYNNGELNDAIDLYQKALEINGLEEVKAKLSSITEEVDVAKQVQEFYDELYNIQKERLRSGITVKPTDMEYIIKDLRILTEKFEKLDDTKETEIAQLIKEIKESLDYKLYKIQVDSKLHDDSGLSEAFGELDSGMNMLNTLAVAETRNTLNKSIEGIIGMSIPEKY